MTQITDFTSQLPLEWAKETTTLRVFLLGVIEEKRIRQDSLP